MKKTIVLLIFVVATAWSCQSTGDHICTRKLVISPSTQAGSLELYEGSQTLLIADVESSYCDSEPLWNFKWLYDSDGNQVLDEKERSLPVATASEWLTGACFTDRGNHSLEIVAEAENGEMTQEAWTVQVRPHPSPEPLPACYDDAIMAVQEATTVTWEHGIAPIEDALTCLAPYLESNICDFQATAAAALAGLSAFSVRIPQRFDARNDLTVSEIQDIAENEVTFFTNRFHFLAEKAPNDFVFLINSKFELTVFNDLPYLDGTETIKVLLQGEIDRGDLLAAAALALAMDGSFHILQAYSGVLRYILDMPRLDLIDFDFLRTNLIRHLTDNPEFMKLVPQSEVEPGGKWHLLQARDRFTRAISRLQEALEVVSGELDDQSDDLLRYWDCGSDGLCPCDDRSLIKLACPNDPADYVRPDKDNTEHNGRYDRNEPVGVDRIALTHYFTLHLPADIEEFNRQAELIHENLIGPDALDLDKIALVPVTLGLKLFSIPAPEIRLSQWFLDPGDPRDMIPLYDKETLDFVFDAESESYQDLGYDGKDSKDEVVTDDPNPRNLALGTPWDKVTNPDPAFDDLDPICNPVCNFIDGLDNDGDGLTDLDDRVRIDQFGYVVLLPQEIGPEGNLMFDFVDYNGNALHDSGETSEPFTDSGVVNYKGDSTGKANGKWDFADRAHEWPTGDRIGPVSNRMQTDPPNGVVDDPVNRLNIASQDRREWAAYTGLFDPFYFFFPHPTFSGVIVFPDEVVGISNEPLTENAKLMRFANKILEVANLFTIGDRTGDGESVPPLNLGGHICSKNGGCK